MHSDTRKKFRNIIINQGGKAPHKTNIMQTIKRVLKKANKILKECAKGAAYAINN